MRADSKRVILVVDDDDKDVRFVLTRTIRSLGMEAAEARNGEEALLPLSMHTLDGIVQDMHMPVLDSGGVRHELDRRGTLVPVAVLSGGLTAQGADKIGQRPNVRSVMAKPFDNALLAQAIKELPSSTKGIPHLSQGG